VDGFFRGLLCVQRFDEELDIADLTILPAHFLGTESPEDQAGLRAGGLKLLGDDDPGGLAAQYSKGIPDKGLGPGAGDSTPVHGLDLGQHAF